MAEKVVYLDYNATTPVDADVLEKMLPFLGREFGNPASAHPFGRRAADAIELAREQVATLVGSRPNEVVFTSGATEANNLALKGAVEAASPLRRRVVVCATEHKSVLDVCDWLSGRGSEVVIVPVDSDGGVNLDFYEAVVDEQTALVSVMAANNETGVVSLLSQLSDWAHSRGALFHTDATQAVGRISVDLRDDQIDLASISAHKIYGPKGIGALVVRRRSPLAALIHGGGHEGGMRSGTPNVPGIVGLGAAADLAGRDYPCEADRQNLLIQGLLDAFGQRIPDFELMGVRSKRLPNTANVRFVGADAEAVMANAPWVAVSAGSACSSMVPSPSHVLLAMGLGPTEASECLRFSVGRPTTEAEIKSAVDCIAHAVERVREMT